MSVLIPSRNDPHLQATINDIRAHAKGEIEIIAVLDGGGEEPTGADKVIVNRRHVGLRGAVNQAVEASSGEWLMKIDAHCMFDDGFDVKLLENIEKDWVVTPIRYKLDVDKWQICEDDQKPIIYERLVIDKPDKIGGVEWRSRKRGREHILIDENMIFQGSCWVMSREHFKRLGGLSEVGYGTFTQEPVEIALKTWLGGGKVMINKKTWYAHKHRKYRRTYGGIGEEVEKGNKYSQDYWLNNRWTERKYDLDWLMKRFGA